MEKNTCNLVPNLYNDHLDCAIDDLQAILRIDFATAEPLHPPSISPM